MGAKLANQAPLPPIIPVGDLKPLLAEIFPEGTAHRNYVIREIAAKTVFVMLYTGAVEGSGRWFRPAQATLMSDAQATKADEAARRAWAEASLINGKLRDVPNRWYATNTREPIRDETLRSGLVPLGAVIERTGVPTTSGLPRYALSKSFAQLLINLSRGDAGPFQIASWRKAHLSAEALARVKLIRAGTIADSRNTRLQIKFPNGETRLMVNGPSALITKAVVEDFAPRFLNAPAILWISDSGEKVVARDDQLARQVGLRIEVARNLPDIILVDGAPQQEKMVFIEVVATDGAITAAKEGRSRKSRDRGEFLEALDLFRVCVPRPVARRPFKKLISELAWDSFAWFVSEPANLLHLAAGARLEKTGISDRCYSGSPSFWSKPWVCRWTSIA